MSGRVPAGVSDLGDNSPTHRGCWSSWRCLAGELHGQLNRHSSASVSIDHFLGLRNATQSAQTSAAAGRSVCRKRRYGTPSFGICNAPVTNPAALSFLQNPGFDFSTVCGGAFVLGGIKVPSVTGGHRLCRRAEPRGGPRRRHYFTGGGKRAAARPRFTEISLGRGNRYPSLTDESRRQSDAGVNETTRTSEGWLGVLDVPEEI
ncbi:hypothetical protein Bbelb_073930 [Branchiostoma belcheri]|nr:hypothetical protein Bbelb_073930 [Branchiostoma belcheri]